MIQSRREGGRRAERGSREVERRRIPMITFRRKKNERDVSP